MSSDTKRITVRIPVSMAEELEEIVSRDNYSNVSEVIRAALDSFIEAKNAPEYISNVTVALPKKNVDDIQDLVNEGDSISVDDAIRNAVREYVRDRLTEFKKHINEE